jgi:hypothetical protein
MGTLREAKLAARKFSSVVEAKKAAEELEFMRVSVMNSSAVLPPRRVSCPVTDARDPVRMAFDDG